VPSAVVGSGINVPAGWSAVDVRARFDVPDRFLLYAGRIDRNKGVDRLFAYYRRLQQEWPDVPPLVLVGRAALEIPADPKIVHLGFVSEEEKFALLHACDVLLMPSAYESLSVIVLEAWAMGRPVLVNSACRVLEGQCVRSGGGLFYRGYSEFAEALRLLLADRELRSRMGVAGHRYAQSEYDWSVVESRTETFLAGLLDDSPAARK
jgi:glycosyltransferase involved in cell wall biosynthesis